MTRARYPLPTDLVALVSFDGRIYPNEAKPWDRLGLDERARPLETALEQWFSFATGKHTWVSVRGATIRGLISARRRAKRSAWEVEVLIDADEDKSIVSSLFNRMVAGIGRLGAERIFVRLSAGGHLLNAARDAGFFPYLEQTLYRLGKKLPRPESQAPLRGRVKGDIFGIFQLYSHAVPANVRAVEGVTFREWQAALEPWGGRHQDLVLEEDGFVAGWARVLPGQAARLTALLGSRNITMDELLASAIKHIGSYQSVFALAPDYDAGLLLALERLGFQPAGRYVVMAKRLVRPAEELVREPSGTAVVVN